MKNILTFWGKASPAKNVAGPTWHPLLWHVLDVTASLDRVLDVYPLPQADRVLLLRLALLHDTGKFSIGFQAKVPAHFPSCLGAIPSGKVNGDHTAIGYRMLTQELYADLRQLAPNIDDHAWRVLLMPVCAHHGRPIVEDQMQAALRMPVSDIGLAGIEAARELIGMSMDLIEGPAFAGAMTDIEARKMSWLLAGLVNLADWLGSNQNVFCYEPPGDVGAYWKGVAQPRAIESIRVAGLSPAALSPITGYAALTEETHAPSPLQAWAETVKIAGGPQMFLLEDMTGSGKTEAAVVLAHRMMLSGLADGLFVALPTQATANAIYERLQTAYRRLFAPGGDASLVLTHGNARWNDGFRSTVRYSRRANGDDNENGEATCVAWIADDRRRAFFAQVGVGTVDQAWLSILPTKFAPLRMLALSRRILIIDEAHAYGAYENVELQRLLTFHAAHGGSAIILSATLPNNVKSLLTKAFRAGLRKFTPNIAWPSAYPATSRIDASPIPVFTPIDPRADLPRRVRVSRLDQVADALDVVENAAKAGACVAYIRNTVADALTAANLLRMQGLDPLVFHARYAVCDRARIEAEALRVFGKNSTPEIRRGRVLVATQVAEQSLDLDFDAMVSDLAPIDLLIQRLGRLWRHQRNGRPLAEPIFHVVSPDPIEAADQFWFSRMFPLGAFVYANHSLLWQTAKILFEAGEVESPGGVRGLVEAVYADGALDKAPAGLIVRRRAADNSNAADASQAQINALTWTAGYNADAGPWGVPGSTDTRLGDRITLRLAVWDGHKLTPWAGEPESNDWRDVRRVWARSEINLRWNRARDRGTYAPEIEAACAALETVWQEFGDDTKILPLLIDQNDYVGFVFDGNRDNNVTYDATTGLTF
jgi:CRISPR-associated endonuclease/helicase Cas3